MSSSDRVISLVTQLALATDGAVAGVGLAYGAIQAWICFRYNSFALDKIRRAEAIPISDLRSLLSQDDDQDRLVIVRGSVEAKSKIDGSLRPNVLVSYSSGEEGVVWQKTQTCIYNDSKGLFGWTRDLQFVLGKSSWKDPKATSLRAIPFVLVGNHLSQYVGVDLDGSNHPLPLVTVHHHLQPLPTSPYTFFQALAGQSYPVGLLDEEKLLPLGKEISAIGICHGDPPHIKPCQDLPYFLSNMTKDEMLDDITHKTNTMFWCAIILGSLSIGVLGYAITKNWRRWKEWIQQRQLRRSRNNEIANEIEAAAAAAAAEIHVEEESEDVPDGQLCVICLMRRKRSAFVPCGHFVCCHRCALSVERDPNPKCPLCRQTIRTSVRIYDS